MYSESAIGLRLGCLYTKVDFQGILLGFVLLIGLSVCLVLWFFSFQYTL